MNYAQLLDLHDLAKASGAKYTLVRTALDGLLNDKGKHLTGIVGPRGVGKTVLLKQYAAQDPDSFYISVDTVKNEDLFDMIRQLHDNYGYKTFLLDEVHFYKDIDGVLKKIYDFLDVKVFFTSSVALAMHRSAYDLSRRIKLIDLGPFSFREYLLFRHGKDLKTLSLNDIINKKWDREHLLMGRYFDEYLRGGLMPFALEEPNPLALQENILSTVIHKDIPQIAKLYTDELAVIEKLMRFIGRAGVDGINYSSLSTNVGITKYKAEAYVQLLKQAFVLTPVMPRGTNVQKQPKVLLAPPYRLLYRDYEDCIGGLREDFFAQMMKLASMDFYYLKSTRGKKTPDFLVENNDEELVIEIGGKGKGREQFKGLDVKKQLILAHGDVFEGIKRPLYLLGYIT